jgi:hypothetical protein
MRVLITCNLQILFTMTGNEVIQYVALEASDSITLKLAEVCILYKLKLNEWYQW